MKGLFHLIGLALIFGLSHHASAGPYEQIKSRSACEQAGAVWDQETSTASRTPPRRLVQNVAERGTKGPAAARFQFQNKHL
jgi:hypothetical protein